jgi:hypothetical protein
MKTKKFAALVIALALTLLSNFPAQALARAASEEGEVRSAVQRIFQQLKSGRYDALYDSLPSNSQKRMSRERFTSALKRAQGTYELDRLEIGAVRVSGDLAVVDTVMYGRVLQPVQSEGKIVAQQYLIRENGTWRVATGDRATIQQFLSANPTFARKFPVRRPQILVKQNGKWVDVSVLMQQRRAKP